MCKRLFILVSLVLLLSFAPHALAQIPIVLGPTFDAAQDINPNLTGNFLGGIWQQSTQVGGQYDGQAKYIIQGGGNDIYGNADQFYYAYKTVTGSWRLTVGFDPITFPTGWTKVGAMFRASVAPGSVQYDNVAPRNDQTTGISGTTYGVISSFQKRTTTGGSSSTQSYATVPSTPPAPFPKAAYVGIQMVVYKGLPFLEAITKRSDVLPWERVVSPGQTPQDALTLPMGLPSSYLLGVAFTSHDGHTPTNGTYQGAGGQAYIYGPTYTANPSFVGAEPVFPIAGTTCTPCLTIPGFNVRTVQSPTALTNFTQMDAALLTPSIFRIDPVVNLLDSGSVGAFTDGPPGGITEDVSFPGIDPFEKPVVPPAGGDIDTAFATEILACIQLTQGLHMIGAYHDDGVRIRIGGVEVGSNTGYGQHDWVYEVATPGTYSLEVRSFQNTGGGSLELSEILYQNGTLTRILLGDVASGGSPVYVPEPATVALLGLGGLSLLGRRRRR